MSFSGPLFLHLQRGMSFYGMPALFSYGTLQQADVQLTTFSRLLQGHSDELIGFRSDLVEITDPHVLATSGKTHHPIVRRSGNPADRVPGTVFEISAEELAQADSYEVADYKRVEASLASGGVAWVYIAASDP